MTKEERIRRARKREERRRIERMRKIVLTIIFMCILIPVVYGIFAHVKIKKLNVRTQELNRQIQDYKKQKETLAKKLKETEEELQEKKEQLQTQMEAYTDHPDKPNVYLTFDDGPSDNTDKIIDTLDKYNVKATFFCVAHDGEKNAERYLRIVQDGNTLGMHSYTHDYKTIYSSLEEFENDVQKISDFLYNVTGVRSQFYRFPGGTSNTVSKVPIKDCIRYINEQNITYFDWNAQNDDATGKNLTSKQLADQAMAAVKKQGDQVVLLMHDEATKTATADSLEILIPMLQESGYDILPISSATEPVQHVKSDSVG